MSTLSRRFRRLWPVFVASALSACSLFPESTPQDIYRLPPSTVAASRGEAADIALRINHPAANDVLSSTRIVVVPEGNRLSVYTGARWSTPAPFLWRDHLLDAFRSDGRIARLSSAAEGLQADVELGGELRAFQTEYRAGLPEVVIRLDARLVEAASKRIIASRRFAVMEAVNGEDLPAVVDAFGRANDTLARELIDWTIQNVQ
jgi:cholesterol transport system auxiliary component